MIILCSSLRSSIGETILQTIDDLKLSQSILLAIDVSSFIPFLPKIINDDNKKLDRIDREDEMFQNDAPMYSMYYSSPLSSKNINYLNLSNTYNNPNNDTFDSNSTDEIVFEADNTSYNIVQKVNETLNLSKDMNNIRKKRSWPQHRYEMFANISTEMKKSFMILTSMDSKNIVSDLFVVNATQKNELYEHIMEGLNTILIVNSNDHNKKVFKFLFLDWKDDLEDRDSHWRPLMILQSSKNGSGIGSSAVLQQEMILNMVKIQPNFDDWFKDRGLEFDEDSCDDDFCIRAQIKMNSTHIIIIVVSALLFTVITIGVALIIR